MSTPDESLILNFSHYPGVRELFPDGGKPGVTYAVVLAERQAIFIQRGWRPVVGAPVFLVNGIAMNVLGWGSPIWNSSPQSSRCPIFVDKAAPNRTGIPVAEEAVADPHEHPPAPTNPLPTPKKAASAPLGAPEG